MLFSKKDLQKLIIPLMFEQLLAVSVGMVDTLMAVSYTHLGRHGNNAVYFIADSVSSCSGCSVCIDIFCHQQKTKLHCTSTDCRWKTDFQNRKHFCLFKTESFKINLNQLSLAG